MFFLSENGDRCGVFIIFCLFTYCFMRFYACYYQNLTVLLPRIMRAYAFTVSIILARESIVILNYKGISLTTIAALWSAHVLTVSLKQLLCMCFFSCVITGGGHAVRAEEGPGSERNCSAIPPVFYSTYILTLSMFSTEYPHNWFSPLPGLVFSPERSGKRK